MQKYIHSLVNVVIVIICHYRYYILLRETITDLEGITRYLRTEYVCVFPDYSLTDLHKECDQNQILLSSSHHVLLCLASDCSGLTLH